MSSDNSPVVIYWLETFLHLANLARREANRHAVEQIAQLKVDVAIKYKFLPSDEQAIQQRFAQIKLALKRAEKTGP